MCVWRVCVCLEGGAPPPPLRPNIMVGARLLHAVPGLTAVHQAVDSCCAALDKLLAKLSAVLVELLISCSPLSAAELCSSCLNQIIAARTHTQPRSQGLENIPEKLKHSLLPQIVKACSPTPSLLLVSGFRLKKRSRKYRRRPKRTNLNGDGGGLWSLIRRVEKVRGD